MAASQDYQELHFILLPLMAQGHMIPMIDMARLFVQRGVMVTIVTTPLNALRFKTIIDRNIQSSLPIRLLQLSFPYQEAGSPEGCENVDTIASRESLKSFFLATRLLQDPFEQALAEMHPTPSCIVSDFCFPWTTDTARKFNIPRLMFHGTGCLLLLSLHNITGHKLHESITDDSEPFMVPDLPDPIQITKLQLPRVFTKKPDDNMLDIRRGLLDTELNAYGVVMNTYTELEPRYVELYQKAMKGKAWCVGPVSQCNKNDLDKSERGNKASIDKTQCLKWLDLKEPNSVIYVCFGSLCRLIPAQLIEIGRGLEASNVPFIWVIRDMEGQEELEEWLSKEGFEDRVKDRGLIIKGWAPQVLILSHLAIGGFLTHCGWNSTLEGVSAGVPMVTWPMFGDQFLNEKLVVQVLGIGVSVGVSVPVHWGDEEKVGVLVKKEGVAEAVRKLMDEGEEGEQRRKKVRELGEMGKKSMEEGGSSYMSMTQLIEDIKNQASKSLSSNKFEDKCPLRGGST